MGSRNKERLERFGLFSKGLVHAFTGIISGLIASSIKNNKAGSSDVMLYVGSQSYGKILLSVTALALFGYVFRRFYQTFADHIEEGEDTKGVIKRLAYFGSGLVYGFMGYTALKIIVDVQFNIGERQSMVSMLLEEDYGQVLIYITSFILALNACYQFYRAYIGKFRENLKESVLSARHQNILLIFGKIAFTARGFVIFILSLLFFKAAWNASIQPETKRIQAFDFMLSSFGVISLTIVALGLVIYAAFLFTQLTYRRMYID